MSNKRKLAYVVHPITPEQKQAIMREGYKIRDAKFAPKGAEILDPNKPGKKPKADKPE